MEPRESTSWIVLAWRGSLHYSWLPRWLGLWTVLAFLLCTGAAPVNAEDLRLPRTLTFEANRGQVDEQVKFLARGRGYVAFFTPTETVFALRDANRGAAVVRLKPVGAAPAAVVVGESDLPGVANYGGQGKKPVTAPTFERVRYRDLYPGIDLEYYGRGTQLEYDFVLAPGADPGVIALAVDGAERVEIDAAGDLVVRTVAGELRQHRPIVYQEIDGERRPVTGEYRLDDEGRVRIRLGAYDASQRVVIDPVVAYSTYIGGSNDEQESLYPELFGIARDPAGNVWVTGTTTSVNFPTTAGAYQTLWGKQDGFVTKFSPTGAVVFSSYIGGPCEDMLNTIAVDAAGNAYAGGRAHSLCFFGEGDPGALVVKLNPTGGVEWALVFGGQYADISMVRGITVDAAGHAYITGTTSNPDFPTTAGSYRPASCPDIYTRGYSDGFVAKVEADGSALMKSTFLCGNGSDSPNAIALDGAGNVYVAGFTTAGDFPMVNPLQPTHLSFPFGKTGFVSKLNGDLSQLLYSTYLGGEINDTIRALAVDGQGNAYVTGETTSNNFPTTPGVIQPTRINIFCIAQFCTDAFVAKINPAGNALVYSTYLFGEGDDSGNGIAVDAAGNAYVVGVTASLYFPVADGFQAKTAVSGPSDAFLTKLSPDATHIVYSSYFGGSGGAGTQTGFDVGAAITIDAAGNAYIAGYTQSWDLPTTPNAYQSTNGGGACDYFGSPCGDAFFAKITAGGPGPTPATRLDATPIEVAPGALVTATWAGVPLPSAGDFLRLYPLGGKYDLSVASWVNGGGAAGTMTIAIPANLPFGTYELRVISTDPDLGDLEAVARSKPIHVGLAAADLIVANVTTTPAAPMTGQPVTVTVTVTNQGNLAAGGFAIDFYKDRAGAPGAGVIGDVHCVIAGLAAAASTQCNGTVTYTAAGTFSAWAQVDTMQAVTESSEGNNVAGPRTITVTAPAGPDLLITAIGNPPAGVVPGKGFTVTDTVKNQGGVTAAATTNRYYMSLDGTKNAGDTLLTGTRTVAALAAGAQSAGTVTVTVPAATPPGTYQLLACADDLQVVTETNETNNCRAAATTVVVGYPDLVEIALTNPPAAARPGSTFSVTDTVKNQGAVTAGASTTRYYASLDMQKGAGDKLFTVTHAAVALAPGAVSTKTVTLTIPTTTPVGTYWLLACADDLNAVVESNEQNNCRASATTVTVALPDLVQQSVGNPAGPVRRGTAFTVSDTVRNQSLVATTRAATTRYYVSLDGVKSTNDIKLTGSRTVPILAAGATSAGTASVTIPTTVVPGTYVVFACADDAKGVGESSEANNCVASPTLITVTP